MFCVDTIFDEREPELYIFNGDYFVLMVFSGVTY
jgi:hypothetical protein